MTVEVAVPKHETDRKVNLESLRFDYLDEIYAYASRRLSREDAEDATAETFQAAIDKLHRLREVDARLWLLGIARRKVADVLRRNSRRREAPLADELPDAGGRSLEQTEADRRIRSIVMSLPADRRDVLLLQHLEELSIVQIAVVMRKSPAAVNSLLQRARAEVFRRGQSYFLENEVNR